MSFEREIYGSINGNDFHRKYSARRRDIIPGRIITIFARESVDETFTLPGCRYRILCQDVKGYLPPGGDARNTTDEPHFPGQRSSLLILVEPVEVQLCSISNATPHSHDHDVSQLQPMTPLWMSLEDIGVMPCGVGGGARFLWSETHFTVTLDTECELNRHRALIVPQAVEPLPRSQDTEIPPIRLSA